MVVHYLLTAIIIVSALFFSKKDKKTGKTNISFYILIFLVFFCISTLRAHNVGNDTENYYRLFSFAQNHYSLKTLLAQTRYEVGFILLNIFAAKLFNNYTILLGLINGFYLFSVFRFINKYSDNAPVSIILFFSFSLFYDIMIIQRQCIAMAIFLYAIDYMVEKKFFKYAFLVLIASLFHQMALLLLAVYFLPHINLNKTKDIIKWAVYISVVFVFLNSIINLVIKFFPYYGHYFYSKYSDGGTRIASIVFFFIRFVIILLLTMFNGLKMYNFDFNEQKKILSKLMLLDVLFSFLSIGFNLFDRIEVFFTIAFIVFISNVISLFKIKSTRNFLIMLIVLITISYLTISLIHRPNWYGIFPYYFIWE